MIKFGNRHNLIYLLLLTLFIALRRIESIIMGLIYNYKGPFLLAVLIFLSKFLFGLFGYLYSNSGKKINPKYKFMGITLIQTKKKLKVPDKQNKIMILMFLASYFDFVGTVVRKFYIKTSENNTIEHSVRSFQVFSSAIFCYLLLKTHIYRHHLFSLIIIFFCLILIVLVEIFCLEGKAKEKLNFFLLTTFSCAGRALLDTIEKYLFDYDFMNPFKVMMFEGLINTILTISLFFVLERPLYDINELIENISKYYYLLVFFLLLYLILSGLKNIYRVITIKIYSPMARALAESVLDPFIVAYYLIRNDYTKNDEFWIYCGVIMFCSIIMPFSSCVYNEFIILYCCKLEYNTHVEITNRANRYDSEIILNLEEIKDDEDSNSEKI